MCELHDMMGSSDSSSPRLSLQVRTLLCRHMTGLPAVQADRLVGTKASDTIIGGNENVESTINPIDKDCIL